MDKNHYLARAMEGRMINRYLMIAIHASAWGLMFGFPLLFTPSGGRTIDWGWYAGYCMVPVGFMLVFYVNYFGLIGRLLFRRRVAGFVAANAGLILAVVLLLHLWFDFYRVAVQGGGTPPPEGRGPHLPMTVFMLRDMLMLGLTAALSVAIRVTGNWYRTETQRREAEQARTLAELQNLRSQIHPHFLFNTLNNIYSLIAVGPERAQEAVLQLSGLLRHVLYEENRERVPLEKELAFVRSYVELMSLRLPGTVRLGVDIPEFGSFAPGVYVAPLLFMTLVENAFKHGVSADAPSFVDISLEVIDDGRAVVCRIVNSYFPKRDGDRSGSGIGLENLRRRLKLLYPGRHTLRTEREGDAFVAEMTLKFRT